MIQEMDGRTVQNRCLRTELNEKSASSSRVS